MIGRESGYRSACELTEEGTIQAFNPMRGRVRHSQQGRFEELEFLTRYVQTFVLRWLMELVTAFFQMKEVVKYSNTGLPHQSITQL